MYLNIFSATRFTSSNMCYPIIINVGKEASITICSIYRFSQYMAVFHPPLISVFFAVVSIV